MDDLFDVDLEPQKERKRGLSKSKRKREIVAELTGQSLEPVKKELRILPNAIPENVILDAVEIEEAKRKIERDALRTVQRHLETRTATCPQCGGSGQTPGKQFMGYDCDQKPIYESIAMVCSNCFGEGIIYKKTSDRMTEMVVQKHFPKTSVNFNVQIDSAGRDGLIDFINNA